MKTQRNGKPWENESPTESEGNPFEENSWGNDRTMASDGNPMKLGRKSNDHP